MVQHVRSLKLGAFMRVALLVGTLGVAALVGGCVSDVDQAHTVEHVASSGQCDPADTQANTISNPGLRAFEHAYVASNCRRDGKAAVGWFNLGARYGSADAQRELARRGLPIPEADLLAAQRAAAERANRNAETLLMLLNAGMSGYNQGRAAEQARQPISTSCTTTSGITNCFSY